ncbi:MAG: serine/threonine-protein kinase [Gemmatimonadetes bacterium]|nr:serine/threonine-protein kinase [Gemmatimonadota bacterium]
MPDPITRLNAALEGRYRIERELGEGGMATVYLADDIKHERKVALKVLKPELAAVVGAERFLVEIKTTANLQHPHILPLFDSGEADGFLFYVMPYVEGETLRGKIEREKQLAVTDAVTITQRVASALDYAHGHGVVHRDIKPANILLNEQGEPLVADFGIALAVAQAGGGRITETGLSLGTPHYMSPEQATGDRDIDPRSDVYALGCVLYEMLSGDPPFSASSAQAVLVKILTTDAPLITTARRTVPPNVESALVQALEKLPADRFGSAAEFATALGSESFSYQPRPSRTTTMPGTELPATPVPEDKVRPWFRDPRSVLSLVAAAVFAALYAVSALSTARHPEVPLRFGITDFELRSPRDSGRRLAISRDGSMIAVASVQGGVQKLFLRRAEEREFVEIEGTEGAAHPTFSPNGEWLAFAQDGQVRRVQLSGGPVLPVADGNYPHWGTDELIVMFADGQILTVPPAGGDPVPIAPVSGNVRPMLLPDGEAVVFQVESAQGRTLMLAEIESGEVVDLGVSGNNPHYVASGHLVFGHLDQVLMAVRFDLDSHRVVGEPSTVLPSVMVYSGEATQFSVSETGTAVYALAPFSGVLSELVSVDPDGSVAPLPLGEGNYLVPRFSPDGRSLVYQDANQIWLYERASGANPPLTTGGDPRYPFWSRDGRYVYFSSVEENTADRDGFRRSADGSGEAEHLFGRPDYQYLLSESTDGTQLLLAEQTGDLEFDLLIATMGPDSVVFSDYLVAPWNEIMGAISPDGQRVVYVSDETGIREVYIRSFPDAEGQVQVSEGGGEQPVWSPDGAGVYYLKGGSVMRRSVVDDVVGEPVTLFSGNWATVGGVPMTNWDVHPDGAPFIFVRLPGSEAVGAEAGSPVMQLEVVVNWFEELRQRMGN